MAKFQFCNFKNDQKSIFELGKSLKLPEQQFHEEKYFDLFEFTSFLPGLFSDQTLDTTSFVCSSDDCQKVVVAFVSPFRVSKWLLSIPRLAHNTGCP